MNNEELPVYKKVAKLVDTMDVMIESFPREYKDSHGLELRKQGVELLTSLCLANYAQNNSFKRQEYLEKSLGLYESWKFLKRLVYKRKCLSDKQSAVIDELLGEIGKQIMGWKKNVDNFINNKEVAQ